MSDSISGHDGRFIKAMTDLKAAQLNPNAVHTRGGGVSLLLLLLLLLLLRLAGVVALDSLMSCWGIRVQGVKVLGFHRG